MRGLLQVVVSKIPQIGRPVIEGLLKVVTTKFGIQVTNVLVNCRNTIFFNSGKQVRLGLLLQLKVKRLSGKAGIEVKLLLVHTSEFSPTGKAGKLVS